MDNYNNIKSFTGYAAETEGLRTLSKLNETQARETPEIDFRVEETLLTEYGEPTYRSNVVRITHRDTGGI